MKIGIDYTSAANQGAGIGRLTRNIVRALAESERAQNEYTLLIQGRELPFPPPAPDPRNVASGIKNANWREVRTRINERWWHRIWHRLRLPLPVEWVIGPVDVFHSPDFTLPPTQRRTRTIVTVHDLSFLRLPHCFEPALLAYLNANVPPSVRRADCVLADSDNTRQDVIELLDVPPERVRTIYCGVEARFRPIDDAEQLERVRSKYDLPERFILSLGTIQPRKNYGALIRAFAGLKPGETSLVIAGGKGWLYQDVFQTVTDLGVQDRVLWPGFVDDVDLPALYNLAELFAFPSLYEGFGLPPLEAMACGTPVIVANNSSLPEVVGDAGLLVDAGDVDALGGAVERLLDDAVLRRSLAERGLHRAKHFTWQKAAQALLKTYEDSYAAKIYAPSTA